MRKGNYYKNIRERGWEGEGVAGNFEIRFEHLISHHSIE